MNRWTRTSGSPGGDVVAASAAAALAFPWAVHALVVLGSLAGAKPLGRAASGAILLGSAGLAVACFRWARARVPAAPAAPLEGVPRMVCGAVSGAAALFAAGAALVGMFLPLFAYDTLGYRLPTVASWLDAGRLAWVPTDDPVRNGYPLGQEAVTAVLSAALGSLRPAGFTSFLYVAGGTLCLWWLGERSGARRPLARAAAALFVLAPMTLLNAPSGYSDAAFAGAVVALAASAALFSVESTLVAAACTGMAAAHVLSLKGTGVAFVGVTALALAMKTRLGAPSRLGLAALVAAPGLFWAARNVAHTGNPLWPVDVQVAGRTVFGGVAPLDRILDVSHNTPAALRDTNELGRVLRTWLEWKGPATDCDDRFAGLGWSWPFFAVPAIAVAAVRAVRAESSVETTAVLVIIGLLCACFVLQPMKWWARYTLWLWGAGGLAIALEGERLVRARSRLLPVVAAALGLVVVSEAGYAFAHASGLSRAASSGASFDELKDVRRGVNAPGWVSPAFFAASIDGRAEICRGAWKPGTDNANLDGVVAQLVPRPTVHVVADDERDWPAVKREWSARGCPELLLLGGSPVLPAAERDPSVVVERRVAFDALSVVRPRGAEKPADLALSGGVPR